MKLIHNFKSPNFNERKSQNIELIIIHYTALKNASESIKYLCSKKNKVSSHYLISRKGQIFSLVSDKNRAWHAGKSYWKGKKDLNSISIGIELDYFPDNDKKFTSKLNESLIALVIQLVKKYKILPENILGHSDIAPYRKIDPGKYFPWSILENKKLAKKIQPTVYNEINLKIIKEWSKQNKFKSTKTKILFMLNNIGYDTSLALKNNIYFNKLIDAYSSRFRYYRNYYYNKKNIFSVIEQHFFNIMLTKIKK